jgi:Ulp1 family protease
VLRCPACGDVPNADEPLVGFLTRGDLNSLQPDRYVNDAIIEAYLHLLADRNARWRAAGHTVPRVAAFSTQFYVHLCGPLGYEKVRREGGRRLDLFGACDQVLVPINRVHHHWSLAVVNVAAQRLEYYDSLGHRGTDVLLRVRDYLRRRSADARAAGLTAADWLDAPRRELFYRPGARVPRQVGPDCGVFVCLFADCVAHGVPLATDPPPFDCAFPGRVRRRLALQLLCGCAL